MIKDGSHVVYLKKMKEIEEMKVHKIWSAEKWREYQIQNIQNAYDSEKRQAEDEFISDKKNNC